MIVLNSPMSDITSLYTSLGVVQLHTGLSVILLYLVPSSIISASVCLI